MHRQTLTAANQELFRRTPDEAFVTLQSLWDHCQRERDRARDHWLRPDELSPTPLDGRLDLAAGGAGTCRLNSWSFTQLCQLAGLNRDTVNRLTPETAGSVFRETLPRGGKPIQLYVDEARVRSIHAASYTRLHNTDLLAVLREFATDFTPPQEAGASGSGGGTGLYCGEQDMFTFMIDATGWIEIDGEAFAPGFFLWNSEVGRRSVGVQTFWFQAVCQNHIVWDAVEVVDFARKHTANVHGAIAEIRTHIERLVERRDARRDQFAAVIRKAMGTELGADAEDVLQTLGKHGISRTLAKHALDRARQSGRFTIFSVVDALTRAAGRYEFIGDRTEVEATASRLLALAV